VVKGAGLEKLFAVCTPGLEPFTALELDRSGLIGGHPASQSENFLTEKGPQYESGGIEFQGSLHDVYRANLYLRDAGAIQAARANAERAGVADCIEFSRKAISAIDPPPGPGWVVTNPPYGVRLKKTNDLRNLYAQLGKVLRTRCPGWRVTVLCDRVQLIRSTGLEFDRGISMMNGGLKVRLLRCLVKS